MYRQSKPLANQHVTIRSKPSGSPRCGPPNSPERKTTCSTRHIHSADMTLSAKQLKRPTLKSYVPPKKPLKSAGLPAPLLPWLTAHSRGSTLQDTHTDPVWHAWPFPGRTAGSPHTAPCAAEKATRCQAGSATAAHLGPSLLPSREQARWMPGTAERQPLNLRGSQPQNKGTPSEFGSDIRLVVFPTEPLSGVKISVSSGLLHLFFFFFFFFYKSRLFFFQGSFFFLPFIIF